MGTEGRPSCPVKYPERGSVLPLYLLDRARVGTVGVDLVKSLGNWRRFASPVEGAPKDIFSLP